MIAKKEPIQIVDFRETHEKELYGSVEIKGLPVKSMTLEDL